LDPSNEHPTSFGSQKYRRGNISTFPEMHFPVYDKKEEFKKPAKVEARSRPRARKEGERPT